MKQITILGDGSWGTACATICAHNQISVTLWCYNEDVANSINNQHENSTYLSDITLDTQYITATTSLQKAVQQSDYICYAIPVKYLRSVIHECTQYMHTNQTWISLSKGIEDSGLLPTQIIDDIAPVAITTGVLSGPSFAREVAHKKPTGLSCAMHTHERAQPIINAFTTNYTTVSYSNDIIGTQITGALKNIYALASGIIDTHVDAHNTNALLVTQAITEIREVIQKLGGQQDTVFSRAGIGDLVLTCHGGQSRNRRVGQKIGSGISIKDYLQEVDFVPEGINTVKTIQTVINKYNITAPIIQAMYHIIENNESPHVLIDTLLS